MGWVYNLKTPDPHSHVPRVIAISLAFPIAALLAVLLRLYARIYTKRAAWVDDYAALFSAILAIAYGGIAIARESSLPATVEHYCWSNADEYKNRDGVLDWMPSTFLRKISCRSVGFVL